MGRLDRLGAAAGIEGTVRNFYTRLAKLEAASATVLEYPITLAQWRAFDAKQTVDLPSAWLATVAQRRDEVEEAIAVFENEVV